MRTGRRGLSLPLLRGPSRDEHALGVIVIPSRSTLPFSDVGYIAICQKPHAGHRKCKTRRHQPGNLGLEASVIEVGSSRGYKQNKYNIYHKKYSYPPPSSLLAMW